MVVPAGLRRASSMECPNRYDPTVFESYQKTISVDGHLVEVEIYDIAGQVRYHVLLRKQRERERMRVDGAAVQDSYFSLLDTHIRSANGYVIVYSITERRTFVEVKEYHDRIMRIRESAKVPLVLVGNKVDLEDEAREVATDEGRELAEQLGCPFFETSAKMGFNVTECFEAVVRQIMRSRAAPTDDSAAAVVGPELGEKGRGCCGGRCSCL